MSVNLTNATQGGNFVQSRAGGATANVVIGTTSANVTTQNLTYSIKGKLYYVAGTTASVVSGLATDANTGAAFKAQPANSVCAYLIGLNAAGTLVATQGPIKTVSDTAAGSTIAPLTPFASDVYCPMSYVVVVAGSTAAGAWILGTSNWTGVTGMTAAAAVDLGDMPNSDPTN